MFERDIHGCPLPPARSTAWRIWLYPPDRTCGTLATESKTHGSVSLLGLSEGDAAYGRIDRTMVDVSLVFAVAGLVLAFVGWYTYLAILPLYVE